MTSVEIHHNSPGSGTVLVVTPIDPDTGARIGDSFTVPNGALRSSDVIPGRSLRIDEVVEQAPPPAPTPQGGGPGNTPPPPGDES